jgi:phosphoenolpyruvate---glycerone phosphotransferase subunit DhaK
MQRILNNPGEVVNDMLKGFLKAHRDIVAPTGNPRVVRSVAAPVKDKVGIVTGGGSGHKPAFIGYVGRNMVDAVAVGEVFSSPTAKSFFDAFRAADAGRGVACLYGNYAGDVMNVRMAMELAEDARLTVKTVVANDDVASAPPEERSRRRGVAGEVLMWKAGGARAALGGDLDAVVASAQKAMDNTRSVGIGLCPCTIPAVGHPNFKIKPGTMEVGIGHHGEPGIRVESLRPARDMARMMVDIVLPDLPFAKGDDVVVLLSGLGATPVMELFLLYDEVERLLAAQGISVHRPYVGNFFTSLDMSGVTLTVMKTDSELKELVDLEADCMGLTQFGR